MSLSSESDQSVRSFRRLDALIEPLSGKVNNRLTLRALSNIYHKWCSAASNPAYTAARRAAVTTTSTRPGARQRSSVAAAAAAAKAKEELDRRRVLARMVRDRWERVVRALLARAFRRRGWAALKSLARSTASKGSKSAGLAAVEASRQVVGKLKGARITNAALRETEEAATAAPLKPDEQQQQPPQIKADGKQPKADLVFGRHSSIAPGSPQGRAASQSPTPMQRTPLPAAVMQSARASGMRRRQDGLSGDVNPAVRTAGPLLLPSSAALQHLVAQQEDAGAEQRRRLWGL